MSQLTSHILDTSVGKPAAGVEVELFAYSGNDWLQLGQGLTDDDGRIRDFGAGDLSYGDYKLKFFTGKYFEKQGFTVFYPFVEVVFRISDNRHHHVPLLLNPFGYSTYRGS